MAIAYDEFNMDKSEILFQELNRSIVNIYKVCLEEMGYDLYQTKNQVEYHNYLINNPIKIYTGSGGGNGEWVWVADGTGESIKGKKIGVLGDSLTQTYEEEISSCIKAMGGIPVCKGYRGTPNVQSLIKQGYTLVGGATFNSYAQYKTDWSDLNGCDHVITELVTNDIGGSSFSTSVLTSGMGSVASHLKNTKVHSVGCMPFAFSTPGFGGTMSFGGVKNHASKNGDDATLNTIHEAQRSKCSSLGWHFIDPKSFKTFKKWHEVSAKTCSGGDGVHIPKSVGYKDWFNDILQGAFGGGHWEWRGSSGDGGGGGIGGDLTGIPIEKVKNPQMKEILKHVDRAKSDTFGWYTLKGPKNTYNDHGVRVHGVCTSGPTTWYQYANINLTFWHPKSTNDSDPDTTIANFKRGGFDLVFAGSKEQAKALSPSQLSPGDVCAIFAYYSSGGATSHGAMWTGKDWRSDFIQNGIWVYGDGKGRHGNRSVLIFRHPKLQ